MQPEERYAAIMRMFDTQETVTIPQIMETFDVSIETARRDLRAMEERQMIKKIYGGAIRYNFSGSQIALYKDRSESDLPEKQAIGAKCAEYINDGDTIYIGAGTTALEAAKKLRGKKDLTIVTVSLRVALELIDTDFSLYFLGGKLLNNEWHIITEIPDYELKSFYCSKAIIGSLGITAKHGVTDAPIEYCKTLYKILQRCEHIYYVGANSKFGIVRPGVTCSISELDKIITGSRQKDRILREFENSAHKLVFVDDYTIDETH